MMSPQVEFLAGPYIRSIREWKRLQKMAVALRSKDRWLELERHKAGCRESIEIYRRMDK